MKKILSIFLLLHYIFPSLDAIEIKPIRTIDISWSKENFIKWPGSFMATVDDMFIVLDSKSSNIKVYDGTGKLVNIFGKRGMGPDEFLKPYLSAYKEPFFVVGDFGLNQIFIYKRIGKSNFEFVQKFLCLEMSHDLFLSDVSKLLIVGYKRSKDLKAYNIFEYDFKSQQYDFILPTEISYGLNSLKDFRKAHDEKISYIGPFQFIDFLDDNIYLVWTGDINIIKINRKTKSYVFFGKKTKEYVQPYVTPEIRKAYRERKNKIIFRARTEMSYIRDIFVLKSKKVGLIYIGPFKKDKGMKVILQFYNDNGEFINEFKLMYAKASLSNELFSYFRKDKNLLYILDTDTSEKLDQFHKIHVYMIEE
ncbi:MAG: hypothetical protein PVH61_29200 [Candidatus Aminicenantes bacterium]|jgi:hypothetical protein